MATLAQLEFEHEQKVEQMIVRHFGALLKIMTKLSSNPVNLESLESIVEETSELMEGVDVKDATQIIKAFKGCSVQKLMNTNFESEEFKANACEWRKALEEIKFNPEKLGLIHLLLFTLRSMNK